ncbi:MAG: fimbria/pilus periplasmic chaperone [Ramlibacter sp.]
MIAAGCLLACLPASSSEFAVSPIRAELKSNALTETLTVTNYADVPLRVTAKLMEWTQDAAGADVYKDSSDLVYFPRQLDIPSQGRRLIRVGAKTTGPSVERTYRLFIEEEPLPGSVAGTQVSFYFRFGVPVFLPPATGRALPEIAGFELTPGKVQVRVRNNGNQHFRLLKVAIGSDAGYAKESSGWYSLAGTTRTYSFELPAADCQRAGTLRFTAEGEGVRLAQSFDVEPAACR